jgi:hypothetical protein
MNLNTFAKDITIKEGLKESVSIAQVKEIIKLVLQGLNKLSPKELETTLRKYGKKSKK